jgi:hypothetical protein
MKRWLTAALASPPDSDEFGNDFMHALTRSGLALGWDNPEFIRLTARIANLFRDLSCLIGIVYYCTWLAENRVEDIHLSNPDDLGKTAEEITAFMQSPDIYRYLRAPEQNDEERPEKSRAGKSADGGAARKRPALHVIENADFMDPFAPVPAT